MSWWKYIFLFLWLVFVQAAPVHAAELDAARAAFAAGDFLTAARLAREGESADAYALAARAELAQGDFSAAPQDRRALFVDAEADARRAVALAPDKAGGHLYLALALGFIGRLDGNIAAHFAGLAHDARSHIDRALVLDPNNAWGHALDGGWNLEIARGGGLIGETLYGASFDKGVAAYRRALKFEPQNTAIAYQFALQLLDANIFVHRDEAYRILVHALKPKDEDAVERLARRRAQRLKIVLETRDTPTLKAILREGLGAGAGVTEQKLPEGKR
ncbi:MAG: hypothetical protein Q7T44_13450 [Parvibaculum sp.]|nr:hypothetical protein [Parvibaculum sp.]